MEIHFSSSKAKSYVFIMFSFHDRLLWKTKLCFRTLIILFTNIFERSTGQPRCGNQDNSSSLWPKKTGRETVGGVQEATVLEYLNMGEIWSEASTSLFLFFFVLRARACGDSWYFFLDQIGILTEQGEDVSGSDPAQPAEAGRKTHHPQRPRHRDVDPCLQYQKGSQTHACLATAITTRHIHCTGNCTCIPVEGPYSNRQCRPISFDGSLFKKWADDAGLFNSTNLL